LPILVLHAGKLQIRPNSARLHGKNKGPLELARFAHKELSHSDGIECIHLLSERKFYF
jgi:hypothetical protein